LTLDYNRRERTRLMIPSDNLYRHLHLRGAVGLSRTETFDGRTYTVVPVIALMEGVIFAVNADVPEYVPLKTLMMAPQGWNGRPVVMDHPSANGRMISANTPGVLEKKAFGVVFNTRVLGSKLLMEAWLDPIKAKAVGEGASSTVLRAMEGKPVEVSVGVYATVEDEKGSFNGKAYKATWVDMIPDHLALLSEGDTGACSNAMGCGVRTHLVTAKAMECAAVDEACGCPVKAARRALRDQVVKLITTGDKEGHDFHGNQWNSGGYDGKSSKGARDYYHVTTKEHLDDILTNGLSVEKAGGQIFLGKDFNDSADYINDVNQAVMLRVSLPKEARKNTQMEEGDRVSYADIKPEHIQQVWMGRQAEDGVGEHWDEVISHNLKDGVKLDTRTQAEATAQIAAENDAKKKLSGLRNRFGRGDQIVVKPTYWNRACHGKTGTIQSSGTSLINRPTHYVKLDTGESEFIHASDLKTLGGPGSGIHGHSTVQQTSHLNFDVTKLSSHDQETIKHEAALRVHEAAINASKSANSSFSHLRSKESQAKLHEAAASAHENAAKLFTAANDPKMAAESTATAAEHRAKLRSAGGPGSGRHKEGQHATHPLPDHPSHGEAVYHLKPGPDKELGETASVEKRGDGSYYARADKFDFSAKSASDMRDQLKKYGGQYAGWENPRSAGGPGSGPHKNGDRVEVKDTHWNKTKHGQSGSVHSSTISAQGKPTHYVKFDKSGGEFVHAEDLKALGGPGSGITGHTTLHDHSNHAGRGIVSRERISDDPSKRFRLQKYDQQGKDAGTTYHPSEKHAVDAMRAHLDRPMPVDHLANVESSFREEGMSIHDIPVDRLKDEIAYAKKNSDDTVTVKIPSRSEMSMSLDEAHAVLKEITKPTRRLSAKVLRAASNPEGINQYTVLAKHGYVKNDEASTRNPHRDVYHRQGQTTRESTRSVVSAMKDSQGRDVRQSVTTRSTSKQPHTVAIPKDATDSRWEYYKPGNRPGYSSSSKAGDNAKQLDKHLSKLHDGDAPKTLRARVQELMTSEVSL
jgi:hypothetical protein